jgi:formyltetrahydrofolate hydrolase
MKGKFGAHRSGKAIKLHAERKVMVYSNKTVVFY